MFKFSPVDHHSKMLNVTSRLTVKIKRAGGYLLDSQRVRSSLSVSDVLPGAEESKIFYDHAVLTVMELLVSEVKSLEGLKQLVPSRTSPHPPSNQVIPLKLLFHDEKYTSETILILQQFIQDAALDETPQVL